MKIKGLEITNRLPTIIIAELGTLHLHSQDSMMRATVDAINHGADMVKTQLINPISAWWATDEQCERYDRLMWSKDAWVRYFEEANKISQFVPVFASIFDHYYLQSCFLNVLPAIKLGYKARLMPSLISACIESEKPLIASYHTSDTIPSELLLNENTLIQYVIPEYPIDGARAVLPRFGCGPFQGASLHTNDLRILAGAMALGARTLEVHVMGEDARGADTSFALTMQELEILSYMRGDIFNAVP